MNASGHVTTTAALAALAAYALQFPPEPAVLTVGLAAFGSLLPDLDTTDSTAAHLLGPLTWLPAWCLAHTVGHRGALHSLLAAVLLALTLWLVVGIWAVPLAAGYLAHLLEDCLTPSGVPLLYPLRWRCRLVR